MSNIVGFLASAFIVLIAFAVGATGQAHFPIQQATMSIVALSAINFCLWRFGTHQLINPRKNELRPTELAGEWLKLFLGFVFLGLFDVFIGFILSYVFGPTPTSIVDALKYSNGPFGIAGTMLMFAVYVFVGLPTFARAIALLLRAPRSETKLDIAPPDVR